MANTAMSERLCGKALLTKMKQLKGLNRSEKAKACGYYSITGEGIKRAKIGEFIEAILEAQGIVLEPDQPSVGRGRGLSFQVGVHKNGSIVIGSGYTQQMGLEPGDEFEIKLGYKHIHLNKVE